MQACANFLHVCLQVWRGLGLDDSFHWMREEWEAAEGSAREGLQALWLLSIKAAVRQGFQVRHLLNATSSTFTYRLML